MTTALSPTPTVESLPNLNQDFKLNLDFSANVAVEKLTLARYLKAKAASFSALKHMQRSPAHARHFLDAETVDQPEFPLGSAAHTLILEPEVFLQNVAVAPEHYPVDPAASDRSARNTRSACASTAPKAQKPWTYKASYCRNWRAAQELMGRSVISRTRLEEVTRWATHLTDHRHFDYTFGAQGKNAISLFGEDPSTGLRLKARIDRATMDRPFLTEIVTCRDASPGGFGKAVFQYGYDLKAAFHLHLWNLCYPEDRRTGFVFCCLEKGESGEAAIYHCPSAVIAAAERRMHKLLYQWEACQRTNEWPGYGNSTKAQPEEFKVPGWEHRNLEDKC